MNHRKLARTAHDVRHLCVCEGCRDLADDRDTVRGMHPKCFYRKFGDDAVKALDTDDQAKFRICDIPADLMKILMMK